MFDMSKLGDMAKIAGEAKKMQERQEKLQSEQIEMLRKISAQLDGITTLLKERK
jgi:hypothetical protein